MKSPAEKKGRDEGIKEDEQHLTVIPFFSGYHALQLCREEGKMS